MGRIVIRRALISVSDKTGVLDFARLLADAGVEILSTGGTAALLREHGISVLEVSEYTNFPEMMDGRVKTLHPKVHGGLLGRRDRDKEVMEDNGITGIDLLVVNLYPFEATVARGATLGEAIENIDIGGPAMIRSAAKNHEFVAVVVEPEDYQSVGQELKSNQFSLGTDIRFQLAIKAFVRIAAYDAAIANYLSAVDPETGITDRFPRSLNLQFSKVQSMRYGENPHQSAAFYKETLSLTDNAPEPGVSQIRQIQGKELSYNNVADTDAAFECVRSFVEPACVIVKHANPCGVAVGESGLEAYEKAFQTDTTSAFGGIIAFNRVLDADTAKAILDKQFAEVIIAPGVTADAAAVMSAKKNIRLLETVSMNCDLQAGYDFKRVNGGLLVQDKDLGSVAENDLKVVTRQAPDARQMKDLLFAWKVAKFVKSNAIVYARNGQTIGVGAGQMARVYSAIIAGIKAKDEGLDVRGSVLASDAFFPFRDSIDAASGAGIAAIIQPGGSMRDQEVIDAADEHGIAMVFTSMRHFRH